MELSLSKEDLSQYVTHQITNMFPDGNMVKNKDVLNYVIPCLERLEHSLSHINDKYVGHDGIVKFNHQHTDHYAMFLYLLANTAYTKNSDLSIANKLYALNKALHSVDVYYEVELPDIFFFQHPLGAVLGRAKYSEYLVVYQKCTVGGKDGIYPVIGEGVVLYGGASLIGRCIIGKNVWLSVNTCVVEEDIPDNCVVFGRSPNLVIKKTNRNVLRDIFNQQ